MPRMDGKGPLGNGQQTGGQRGICKQTGIAKPGQDQDAPINAGPEQGQSLGWSRGQGSGGCCGNGLGRRNGGKGQGNCNNR